MFFCEFCETLRTPFYKKTPLMAASKKDSLYIRKHFLILLHFFYFNKINSYKIVLIFWI